MTSKNRYILIGVSILTVVILMASCSSNKEDQPQDYYQNPQPQQAPLAQQSYPSQTAPVIIQSPQSSGFGEGFMGGMLGGMLSNSNNRNHIVERERVIERPSYQNSQQRAVRSPALTPPKPESKNLQAFRSGNWGSKRR